VFPFVFDGRKIAQGRVAPGAIVEAFDELKDGYPRLAVRSEATPIDEFAFEGGEETLAHRIVVGVADRLSRMNASFLAAIAESDRRVLGGFKRSSQHLNEGGCDEPSKAPITPFGTGAAAVTGTAASSGAI
jgi:hypothetical protein